MRVARLSLRDRHLKLRVSHAFWTGDAVCPVEAAGCVVFLGAGVERITCASGQQTHFYALRPTDNFLVNLEKALVGSLWVGIDEDNLSFNLTILEDE